MAVHRNELREPILLEMAMLSVEVRSDSGRVGELLDEDFREIGASGRLWTRSETLAALADDSAYEAPSEIAEMEAQEICPGLVLVTYLAATTGRRTRRSSLWRLADGSWRLVFHQGTLI